MHVDVLSQSRTLSGSGTRQPICEPAVWFWNQTAHSRTGCLVLEQDNDYRTLNHNLNTKVLVQFSNTAACSGTGSNVVRSQTRFSTGAEHRQSVMVLHPFG